MKRYFWLLAIALVLGLGIPVIYGGAELFDQLTIFPLHVLALVLAMVFIGWNLNAGRLRLMLGGIRQPMGQGRALATVIATEFAFCATPAGSGGPVTYVYLLRRYGISGSCGAALYTLDILMDILFFVSALIVVVLILFFDPQRLHIGWQLMLLCGLLGALVLSAWVTLKHYRPIMIGAGRLMGRLRTSPATRRRFARAILRFRQSLGMIFRMSRARLLAIYACCAGHWVLRYSILYVIIEGVNQHISWAYSFLAQALAFAAGQLTLLPGGTGGVELSFTALLAPFLDGATLAAVLLMWRFSTFYWYLIAGAPVFAILAGKALWRRLSVSSIDANGSGQASV